MLASAPLKSKLYPPTKNKIIKMATVEQRKLLDKHNVVPYLQSDSLTETSARILIETYIKGEGK